MQKPHKIRWVAGEEVPTLKAYVRHLRDGRLWLSLSEKLNDCRLEVDGVWYESGGVVEWTGEVYGHSKSYEAETTLHSKPLPVPLLRRLGIDPSDPYPLHTAVVHSPQAIADLIQAGCDLEYRDNNGWTPLQKAVAFKKGDSLQQLLAAGADVDPLGKEGMTPLHWAVMYPKTDMARQLLAAGADADIADERGLTPLQWAVMHGKTEMVRQLLAAGNIDLNVRDETGCTPLHVAVTRQDLDMVSILLKNGIRTDIKSNSGYTALDSAELHPNKAIVALLRAKAPSTRSAALRKEGKAAEWSEPKAGLRWRIWLPSDRIEAGKPTSRPMAAVWPAKAKIFALSEFQPLKHSRRSSMEKSSTQRPSSRCSG